MTIYFSIFRTKKNWANSTIQKITFIVDVRMEWIIECLIVTLSRLPSRSSLLLNHQCLLICLTFRRHETILVVTKLDMSRLKATSMTCCQSTNIKINQFYYSTVKLKRKESTNISGGSGGILKIVSHQSLRLGKKNKLKPKMRSMQTWQLVLDESKEQIKIKMKSQLVKIFI